MSTPLPDEQNAAIRAREAAAHPGPWYVEDDNQDLNRWVTSEDGMVEINFGYRGNNNRDDAEFVAHARKDVPALLAEVDRLTIALEVVTSQSARALDKRDKHKQRAEIANAELGTLRGGLREIGGDPTEVQNLYAQLNLRTRQRKAATDEVDRLRAELATARAQALTEAAQQQRAVADRLPEHVAGVAPLVRALADLIDPDCPTPFKLAAVHDAADAVIAGRSTAVTVHGVPQGALAVMACCGRSLRDLPHDEGFTNDPGAVTCTGAH